MLLHHRWIGLFQIGLLSELCGGRWIFESGALGAGVSGYEFGVWGIFALILRGLAFVRRGLAE